MFMYWRSAWSRFSSVSHLCNSNPDYLRNLIPKWDRHVNHVIHCPSRTILHKLLDERCVACVVHVHLLSSKIAHLWHVALSVWQNFLILTCGPTCLDGQVLRCCSHPPHHRGTFRIETNQQEVRMTNSQQLEWHEAPADAAALNAGNDRTNIQLYILFQLIETFCNF